MVVVLSSSDLLADAHSKLAEVNGQSVEYARDGDVQKEVQRIYDLVSDMAIRYGINGLR